MNQKKLFVGNLPFSIQTQDLRQHFSQFGDVEDAIVIMNRDSGRSKGFGFVTFTTEESAKEALSLDGTDLDGRPMRVNIAQAKDSKGGSGHRNSNFRDHRRGDSE